MNSSSLGCEVAIARAYDDSGVIRPLAMKLNEVLSVKGQDGATLGDSIVQDFCVTDALPSLAGL
jgi:hypothetical protein